MPLLNRLARPAATALRRPFSPATLPRFSSTSSATYENIILSHPPTRRRTNHPKPAESLTPSPPPSSSNSTPPSQPTRRTQMSHERAFAAGADIKEMATLTFSEAYTNNFIAPWSTITTLRKPVIAAVSGHALGGGCELAMMCDILYSTKTANFGQPEIKLGTIPGAGGSQRLTRAIGKSKAMELILTGNSFSGADAEKYGLVAKAFETHEELINGALDTAEKIARYSKVAVVAAKEVVNKSQELSLREGVEFERRVFHGLFGSQDQKVGMKAFAEKKKAEWTHS
ncbi:putative enoyl-CoA hydratase, mitochondrial [Cyphellophora attinorum]|uniref:Putative enoyl-CoA hydratase, mitochondrial n=1 Tax=Cyphellophora attinorum TaxID=1664694 RepID=A0A0N1HDL4_9EURO|nr:putative enoyl-CoA hydratase, mitochondrial [Phialophora attinorum]KPI42562.1 putative enoyl-CoA hydratase, mitochondrial [Phialophora attinorum]